MATSEELLAEIAVSLEVQSELLGELVSNSRRGSGIKLGFCDAPGSGTVYLSVSREHSDCLWHSWDKTKECHIPYPQNALVGRLKKLEISNGLEFKGKTPTKLKVTIEADREYIIQSGLETVFSRQLCLVVSKLSIEALKNPVGIAVEAGKDEKVVLSRVFNPATQKVAYVEAGDNPDWNAIINQAIRKVEEANSNG